MDRKDYKSLMEAYTDIVLDKEFSGENENGLDSENILGGMGKMDAPIDNQPDMGEESPDIGVDEMEENEEEKQGMVVSHLHTIRSHAHEIYSCVENGVNIEPWMQEKIAIANDYIVHVANAIMYRK
jgi:hypothetical protein